MKPSCRKHVVTWSLVAMVVMGLSCAESEGPRPIVVGSKNFTESVLLGELVAQTLEGAGCKVERKQNLGGTLVCHRAMIGGSLDAYVEYSGTAITAILNEPITKDREEVNRIVESAYEEKGLRWGPMLGFNNTFAMIVRSDDAERLGLENISDLKAVEGEFQPGSGYEFVERPDGWPGLQEAYGLDFEEIPRTMELGLTYKALAAGEIDLIAGNSTDGLIESLGLVILEDDRDYFPPYDAAVVAREDVDSRCARATEALSSLAGIIDDETMRQLNYEVDGRKRPVGEVVREFLAD